jgi:hypothetical protein
MRVITSLLFARSAPDLFKTVYFVHVNERSENLLRCATVKAAPSVQADDT